MFSHVDAGCGCALADELQDKSILTDELQEQEDIVSQCVGQLETSESARATLISLLKEALREQVMYSFPC